MPFHNPVFDSLRESTSPIWISNSNGCDFAYARSHGGWRTVADVVARSDAEKVFYFPDANVGILPHTDDVWTYCRNAAIGLNHPNVILTSSAYYEWIGKAGETEKRANVVKEAIERNSWATFFDLDLKVDSPYFEAFVYYLRLFATRRAVAIPDLTKDGRSIGELMNDVVTKIGSRGVELAKKGRKDKTKKGKIDINDEVHVLTSIWFAFKFNREICILTADLDCLEIFYKAVQILKVHYIASLSAQAVFAGSYGDPAAELSGSDSAFFNGPIDLYTPKCEDCRDVLPANPEKIPVHCIYVHNNSEVYQLRAIFNRETVGLLWTKGHTRGLSTRLFDKRNVHMLDIVGDPAVPDGKYIAIGEDHAIEVEEMGVQVRLGMFDLFNTVNCDSDFRNPWFPEWERMG